MSEAALFESADLEIRVTTRDDRRALDYELHSPNGKCGFSYVPFEGPRLDRPDVWKRIFKTLRNLQSGLDSRNARLKKDEEVTELATLGEYLCDQLFPPQLQNALQEVRHAETVVLLSEEPWIPWEIVKPYEADASGEDGGFLASHFQFTRWLSGGRQQPLTCIHVERLAVLEAGSPPELTPLAKAEEESRFLCGIARRHGVQDDHLVDATHSLALSHLKQHDLGLIHFVGHGEHDEEDPESSGFLLHDGRALRPLDLRRSIQRRLQANSPLVFLNACEGGRQNWSLAQRGGWAKSFITDAGCGAFIAPQWTVDDESAHTFAKAFYEALETRCTIGQAALAARRALPKSSLGRWAYAVWAHPNARLELGPAAPAPAPAAPGPAPAAPAETADVLPRRSEPQRLTALLAWYLPDFEGFSRVCRRLDVPVWPMSQSRTATDRWHEVVAQCESEDRLAELRRAACDGFPASAVPRLRDPRVDFDLAGPGSTRQELARRLGEGLPGSLRQGPSDSKWTAEELLGHATLRRFGAAEPQAGWVDLIQGSEVGQALEASPQVDWIERCREHVSPCLDVPLAALALMRTCEERPATGKAALRRTVESLDRLSVLQLDLAGWWLRWWPAGAAAAVSWLREAVDADPEDRSGTTARLSRLERLLLEAAAAPWSRSSEAPSVVRAVRMGRSAQLAALLENLGEERQSEYLGLFSEAPAGGRVPLARSLCRLARGQGGFESLPPEPWGTALRCSLTTATASELEELMRDEEKLGLWLPLLPCRLSEAQLEALVRIFKQRTSRRRQRLAKAAGACLAAHPDPPAVWSRLCAAGRRWIEVWASERTPEEPMGSWLSRLAGSATAGSEAEFLRRALSHHKS